MKSDAVSASPQDWRSRVGLSITEGSRNDALTRIAEAKERGQPIGMAPDGMPWLMSRARKRWKK